MTKEVTTTQIRLKAKKGKFLTDGEFYGNLVILPKGSDETVWKEISKEEYEATQETSITS